MEKLIQFLRIFREKHPVGKGMHSEIEIAIQTAGNCSGADEYLVDLSRKALNIERFHPDGRCVYCEAILANHVNDDCIYDQAASRLL